MTIELHEMSEEQEEQLWNIVDSYFTKTSIYKTSIEDGTNVIEAQKNNNGNRINNGEN
jgi:hypothetical protein